MNKISLSLIISTMFITGCAAYEKQQVVGVTNIDSDKSNSPVFSNVRYIKDIATKIEETRPEPNAMYPTTVILMNNKILSGNSWFNISPTVRAKNRAMCQGWLRLEHRNPDDDRKKDSPEAKKIYNYMLVNSKDRKSLENCTALIANYNYTEADAELTRIFNSLSSTTQLSMNDSPYLALYESKSSPRNSMILPLGELSAKEIEVLVADWENLIAKTYSIGTPFDPYIGLAILIQNNPNIAAAKRENMLENVKIITYVGTCAASVTPPLSLAALISIPACQQAYTDIKKKLGYGNT